MNTARHMNLRVFWLVHLLFVLVVCYEFYENCSPSALIVWPLIIPLLVLNRKRNVFQLNIFYIRKSITSLFLLPIVLSHCGVVLPLPCCCNHYYLLRCSTLSVLKNQNTPHISAIKLKFHLLSEFTKQSTLYLA